MYSEIVSSTHVFIKKEELVTSLDSLRRLFTIEPKFDNLSSVPIYRETPRLFGVPRYYKDLRPFTKEFKEQVKTGGAIKFKMTYPPRERQVPLVRQLVQAIAQKKTGFIISAPTGTGKTWMMLRFIQEVGRTALIVVPRERILDQWIERILTHTNLKREDIGIAQQDKCEFEGKKIVIGMLHSLAKDKYPKEFKDYFGVLAVDEVHTTATDKFSKIVGLFPAKYRVACSATLTRSDGMEAVYNYSMGEVVLEMKGTTDLIPKIILRNYEAQSVPQKLQYVTAKLSRRGVILSALAEDLNRNVLLSVYAKKLMESGRRVLVISDRIGQLETMRELLTIRYSLMPRKVGLFVSQTPKKEKERVLEECDIILATYGVFGMAIDVPDLAAIVYGTPLSEIKQSVGRILRKLEGGEKKEPVVVDFVDTAYEEAVRWARNRVATYKETYGSKILFVEA